MFVVAETWEHKGGWQGFHWRPLLPAIPKPIAPVEPPRIPSGTTAAIVVGAPTTDIRIQKTKAAQTDVLFIFRQMIAAARWRVPMAWCQAGRRQRDRPADRHQRQPCRRFDAPGDRAGVLPRWRWASPGP
jgi:hypothetical protein